ncbi:endonuclease/exonuclease/phosphatase family protein [Endothiovibrio diazotrophicus]
MKLATWNLHRGIGGDGRASPQRCAAVLREMDADVIALQEVESRPGNPLGLLQFLASESGLRAIPGMTMLRADVHYGNALLSRWAPERVRRHDLSVPGREPRGAIDAVLAREGERFRLIATHLGLRPFERREQIRRLLPLIEEPQPPLALMGDWNEWFLWGRPLRTLHRLFPRTPYRRSWPAKMPLFALDRIWVRPGTALLRLELHRSPLARIASDHLPVTAEVEWSEGGDDFH